jgi:CheY-like chemotaxis protein
VIRKCNVLLVDDDEDDRILFAAALKATGLDIDLLQLPDAYAAIGYLFSAANARFPHPNVIFLDLKMLGMDGFAVLKEIRSRPQLKHLTVYVLSNSKLESELTAAHALGANAAFTKPTHYNDLVGLLQSVLTPCCTDRRNDSKRESRVT